SLLTYLLSYLTFLFFLFTPPSPSEIYTLSLHDALPIWAVRFTMVPPQLTRGSERSYPRGSKVQGILRQHETLHRAGDVVRLDFSGAPEIAAPPAEVWKRLLDHEFVASVAPGVESVEPIDDRHFKVISGFGVGAVKV